jgi:hypothetical protein
MIVPRDGTFVESGRVEAQHSMQQDSWASRNCTSRDRMRPASTLIEALFAAALEWIAIQPVA